MNKEDLYSELKYAYKAQNKNAIQALKNVIGALTLAEKSKQGVKSVDDKILKIIEKEVKIYDEQLSYLEKIAGKEAEAQNCRAQKEFLEQYLPQKMSYDQLQGYVNNLIGLAGEISIGEVFKLAQKDLGNTFDNKMLSEIVNKKMRG